MLTNSKLSRTNGAYPKARGTFNQGISDITTLLYTFTTPMLSYYYPSSSNNAHTLD
jgi:hypothetical protein